jgi:uridine phosphorylase
VRVIVHLRPSAPIAADALLPGDPARALLLAQELLAEPKMSNHTRGLWGYYGLTESGRPLTIQSTGIGAPSAAIVLAELAELGVRRAVRVGTCGGLRDGAALGDLLAVQLADTLDGVSRVIGSDSPARPDAALGEALERAAAEAGGSATPVLSADVFPFPVEDPRLASSAGIVDMQSGALFHVASGMGVAAGALLIVSSVGAGARWIEPEQLEQRAKVMGRAALAALEDEV